MAPIVVTCHPIWHPIAAAPITRIRAVATATACPSPVTTVLDEAYDSSFADHSHRFVDGTDVSSRGYVRVGGIVDDYSSASDLAEVDNVGW